MNAKEARHLTRIIARSIRNNLGENFLESFELALAQNPWQVFSEMNKACHYPENESRGLSKIWLASPWLK